MKKLLSVLIGIGISLLVGAQSSPTDTVVVQLARSSQLIFTIEDRSDLELLRHYDFQSLFDDILTRLEESDTILMDTIPANEDEEDWTDEPEETDEEDGDYEEDHEGNADYEDEMEEADDADEEDEDYDYDGDSRRKRFFSTFNMDLGIGNYLEDFKFPDAEGAQYTVRPWGSWYVGLNSVHNLRISESFKFETGLGISWYNFKFQDDRTVLTENADAVSFTIDPSNYNFIKSKLTVAHVNLSIVPVFEFGRYLEDNHWWKSHPRAFRIGLGMYGGFRLGSYTKQVYEIGDDKEKERNHDNFYLKNLRYGVRLQFGIHETDFFINYDLNELFVEGKGPKLNAYSFGIIF